jgi:protein MpaA
MPARKSNSSNATTILIILGINAIVFICLLSGFVYFKQSYTAPPPMIAVAPPGFEATAAPAAVDGLPSLQTALEATLSPLAGSTFAPTLVPTITPTPHQVPKIIGYSVQGRPLEVYTFGNGPVHRMIVAGIHGGYEGNTVELAYQLMDYLYDHPEAIPADVTLYILPNLNPDGYAAGGKANPDARANANGVDLNRNWPDHWQADWSRKGCFAQRILSPGAYAASEPETVALIMFINLYKPDALISYHSAALGIFAGGVPPLPESEALAEAVAAVTDYPYPPLDYGCVYTGNLTDWAAAQNIAAVDIELTDHDHTDFDINLRVLSVFLNYKRTVASP